MVKLIQGRKQNLTRVVRREKFGIMRLTVLDLDAVIENIATEGGVKEIKSKFQKLEKARITGQIYELESVLKATECCEELHRYLKVSLKDVDKRLSNIKTLEIKKDKVNGVLYFGIGLKDLTSAISYDVFNKNPSTDLQEIFSATKEIQSKNWICYSPTFKDYLLNEDGVEYFIEKSYHIDKTFKDEVVEQVRKKMYEALPKLSIRR